MPSFKEKLARNELVRLFAIGRICHPVVVEIFGLAGGYDGFWMDQEHGGLTYDQILMLSLAGRANGFDNFVRMAPTNYALVTQNLEAGAGGVMAARIENATHAEEFVRWAKFAPRGNRGMNYGGRDADYTFKTQQQFAVDANRQQLVAIQIETVGALRDADAIAAIDGVDVLFVGPSDLSQALGFLGDFRNEKLWDAYAQVDAACRKHGKHWGTVAPSPEFTQRAIELGCKMISLTTDITSIRRGLEEVRRTYERYF